MSQLSFPLSYWFSHLHILFRKGEYPNRQKLNTDLVWSMENYYLVTYKTSSCLYQLFKCVATAATRLIQLNQLNNFCKYKQVNKIFHWMAYRKTFRDVDIGPYFVMHKAKSFLRNGSLSIPSKHHCHFSMIHSTYS